MFIRRKILSTIVRTIELDEKNLNAVTYKKGMQWLENFIMKPNSLSGRRGNVCPFVYKSHISGSLFFAYIDVSEFKFDEYISMLISVSSIFDDLKTKSDIDPNLLSMILYIDKVKENQVVKFIDVAHSIVKQIYMSNGQMIGEFHPLSNVEGSRAKKFRPMVSSIPAFAVRDITEHDHLFIDNDSSKDEIRLHEIECYYNFLKEKIPEKNFIEIEQRIEILKSNMGMPL